MSKFDGDYWLSVLIAAVMPVLIRLLTQWLEEQLNAVKTTAQEEPSIDATGTAGVFVSAARNLASVILRASVAIEPEDWVKINKSADFRDVASAFTKQTGVPVLLV